jgi:GWxTD domain-containing protein
MIWPDMPLSLRDIDYALDALKIITREEQLDSMRRGDLETRRGALEAFWKEKDKSPETAYNEVMAEFYRRVDYARKTFGTLREPDGFKSDRGRIVALYGQPTRIERTLDSSAGFRESWSYEKLNKKFVFLDKTKSGAYMLVSTQSL